MKYVFGNTMICRSGDEAKECAFNDKIKARSITLDGDVFDPSGTLTGGASSKGSGVLAQLEQLRAAQQELAVLEAEAADIKRRLAVASKAAASHFRLKEELELKTHEMSLVRTRLQQSTLHQVMEEVKALEETVASANETIEACKARAAAGKERCKHLEKEIKEFASGVSNVLGTAFGLLVHCTTNTHAHTFTHVYPPPETCVSLPPSQRDKKIKQAEASKEKAKAAVVKAREAVAKATAANQEAALEVEALRSEMKAHEEQIATLEAAIAAMMAEEDNLEGIVAEKKEAFDEAERALAAKREKLSTYESDLKLLGEQVDTLSKQRREAELAVKDLEHKRSQSQSERKKAAATVESLQVEHPWIANDKQYFGQAGSAFDFSPDDAARSPGNCRKRLAQLVSNQEDLSKNVNMKVLSMFDKAEKEYKDLLKKKIIVEEDKAKIEAAITELDQKKNDVLTKAHTQVCGGNYTHPLPVVVLASLSSPCLSSNLSRSHCGCRHVVATLCRSTATLGPSSPLSSRVRKPSLRRWRARASSTDCRSKSPLVPSGKTA